MEILVILDLNGTLLESTHHKKKEYEHDYKARQKYVYYRPGMWKFLKFLSNHPRVKLAVWTSCSKENAKAIIEHIFDKTGIPLEFYYSREECIKLPGPGYKTVKDLTCVWNKFPQWNKFNTIMIDDSAEKLQRQPNNLVHVEEFTVEKQKTDTMLSVLEKTLPLGMGL